VRRKAQAHGYRRRHWAAKNPTNPDKRQARIESEPPRIGAWRPQIPAALILSLACVFGAGIALFGIEIVKILGWILKVSSRRTMRTKVITLAVLTLLFSAAQAHADINTLIKFDDLGTTQGVIPDGYAGLHWSNFYYLNGLTTDPAGPIIGDPNMLGYRNGVVSKSNIAYNGFGLDAFFFADAPFTLTSAYFTSTAYWLTTSFVDVTGFLGGNQVGAIDHIAINANTPTKANFDWLVDGVSISTATPRAAGFDVAIDNLQLGQPVGAVPEPGAVFLLGTVGAALLPLVRRRACSRS
jgi:hypothetical protein